MADETDQALETLNTPGVVVEVDKKTADELGAFEEDALSEEDALASAEHQKISREGDDGEKNT